MMKNKKILVFLIIFALVLIACDVLSPSENDVTVSVDTIATAVSATKTADASSEGDPPPEPPQEVTETPTVPAETPVLCQPIHPGNSAVSTASGAALSLSTSDEQLDLFDIQGMSQGLIALPDLSWREPNQVHFAAGTSGGFANIPTIFNAMFVGGQSLRYNQNGSTSDLYPVNYFVTMVGAENYIAFSNSDSSASGGWISELFAGDYQTAGTNPPILTRDEGDGYVIYPLSIQVNNGLAIGVWYTESMWGIGNIIFAPYRGLFYFDFQTATVTTFLNTDNVIAGLSPDNSWVAYSPSPSGNPGLAQNSLDLKNLITCQEVILPFDPTTNLGGGWATFSPDNQYIAWYEAFGPNPMEATTRIKIAQINGSTLIDAIPSTLGSLAGGETPSRVIPFGWADDHILAVVVNIDSVPDPLFVLWAPDPAFPLDPALGANQSALLGSGIGMGFLYP